MNRVGGQLCTAVRGLGLAGVVFAGACVSTPVLSPQPTTVSAPARSLTSWRYIDPAIVKPADALPRPSTAQDATDFESELIARIRAESSVAMEGWARQANADSPYDLVAILDLGASASDGPATIDDPKARFPRICDLLINANADSEEMKKAAKAEFKRRRPTISGHDSLDTYPSGHATRAALQARLLAAIAPERERELAREAWFRALCRLELGVHYTTDVTAGFVFGQTIGRHMLEHGNERFKADLQAAQDEWRKAGKHP